MFVIARQSVLDGRNSKPKLVKNNSISSSFASTTTNDINMLMPARSMSLASTTTYNAKATSTTNIGKPTPSQPMTTESMSSLTGSTTTVETTAIDNFDTLESTNASQNSIQNNLIDLASKSIADWTVNSTSNLPGSGRIDSTNSLPGKPMLFTRSRKGAHHARSLQGSCKNSPTAPNVYKNLDSPPVKSGSSSFDANNS